MREIKWDQLGSYQEFQDIPKVHIANQNITESVNTILVYLKEKNIIDI